jgi:hypothetical protein
VNSCYIRSIIQQKDVEKEAIESMMKIMGHSQKTIRHLLDDTEVCQTNSQSNVMSTHLVIVGDNVQSGPIETVQIVKSAPITTTEDVKPDQPPPAKHKTSLPQKLLRVCCLSYS